MTRPPYFMHLQDQLLVAESLIVFAGTARELSARVPGVGARQATVQRNGYYRGGAPHADRRGVVGPQSKLEPFAGYPFPSPTNASQCALFATSVSGYGARRTAPLKRGKMLISVSRSEVGSLSPSRRFERFRNIKRVTRMTLSHRNR